MTGGSHGGGRAGQLSSSGLRPGWTTGACATAAARAAYVALRTGAFPDPVHVDLPGGSPEFALTGWELGDEVAMAAVTKDAGDDPDVTHGAVVRAWVRRGAPGSGTTYGAGPGVGTVTLPGLPLPVGEPAINPMPRRMIEANLAAAAAELAAAAGALVPADAEPGAPLDVHVRIGIDDGERISAHTLNPRLGIIGGLSVLGTTGVVVPYSCSAWIDAIRRGVDVARAAGLRHVAGCTGSTSERVVREERELPDLGLLDMGDFVGAVLKYLRAHPVDRLTLCGGFAKMSKLADGHLDLHSARSSVNVEFLARLADGWLAGPDRAAGAAGAGGPAGAGGAGGRRGPVVVDDAGSAGEDIRRAGTALGALEAATAYGVPLGDLVAAAARDQALRVLAGAPVAVEIICIDRAGTIVGRAGILA